MTITLRLKKQERESKIVCGNGVFEREFPRLIKSYPQAFVFTDENVDALYGDVIRSLAPDVPVYAMKAGEENKQPHTLIALLQKMAEAGLHRKACLFAVGGGVVGDIGGLAAALYMRGIDCVQVPTTLLSQVDSSVGGKTAVDLDCYKNVVGAFHQPTAVLVDGTFLRTLPRREIACGLGEIIKHGALNGELFDRLYQNKERLFDLSFLDEIVPLNIRHKANVVEADERETGLRKSLNLGHTTGHAVELVDGKLSHGEYVLVGMRYEMRLAKTRVPCDEEYLNRLDELILCVLEKGQMPSVKEGIAYAKLDKKNEENGTIVVTAPTKRGEYALLHLPFAEYESELLRLEEAFSC